MAKIELSDTSFIAVQIIKNSFLSPNPEGLQFFILAIESGGSFSDNYY